jgi:hypothetical protein
VPIHNLEIISEQPEFSEGAKVRSVSANEAPNQSDPPIKAPVSKPTYSRSIYLEGLEEDEAGMSGYGEHGNGKSSFMTQIKARFAHIRHKDKNHLDS